MATVSTLISKAEMVANINTIATAKNSLCIWYLNTSNVRQGPTLDATCTSRLSQLLPLVTTASLTYETLGHATIISTFKALASTSTRVRKMFAKATRTGCGGVGDITYGTNISTLTTTYEEATLKTNIQSVAGPSSGLITATSINNFVTALKNIADLSHGDSYIHQCPTTFCHCSCHSSCHGSRARR